MSTPATLTLADWLMAQIEDDEAVARAATPGPWSIRDDPDYDYGDTTILAALPHPESMESNGFGVDLSSRYVAQTSYDGLSHTTYNSDADATHIARHDPDQVLAECAAKRRIIEDHQPDGTPCRVCVGGFSGHDRWPCPTLRALASIFSDRPGFREEWSL